LCGLCGLYTHLECGRGCLALLVVHLQTFVSVRGPPPELCSSAPFLKAVNPPNPDLLQSIAPDPAAFAAAFSFQGQSPPGEGAAQARYDWTAHLPGSKNIADIYPGRYTK
jgi:hypothetical protein